MPGLRTQLTMATTLWLATACLFAQAEQLPTVRSVESQPLASQVKRLVEAMDYIGSPLSADKKRELLRAGAGDDDQQVTGQVQRLLDPLCLAAVEINKNKQVRVVANGKPQLIEQGWRTYLIKVLNHADVTTTLRVTSPNAQNVPGAPQSEVKKRWLGVSLFNGRPLRPNLSGLKLEYRIIQLYSRDAGKRTATLKFNVGQWADPNRKDPVIRRWNFDQGLEGWKAQSQSSLQASDGMLKVTSTGRDPHMFALAKSDKGTMVLRFWAKFERAGVGQVFWWTKQRPRADGQHRVNFLVKPGQFQEYAIPFKCEGQLAAVRLDPGSSPGKIDIDWIELAYQDQPGSKTHDATLAFDCLPSNKITFDVRDEEGKPTVAAFLIRDQAGRVYPAQAKRLAPDFFFHPQVYRASGETVRLPNGKYTVICARGPESVPETKTLWVQDRPTKVSYKVTRWIDPSKRGWFSGDHHIHAAGCRHYENPTEGVQPEDMIRHCRGEDLKVGCALTWGPCFDFQKQFFTGQVDRVSVFPYLLRYDIEVSGFGSHRSGHLCLLRLKNQMYPGGDSKDHWPTLGLDTLRFAKRQGAITGPAHSAIGLTRFVDRLPDAVDGPGGLPNFNIPAYDGIGANEYVVDITHNVPGPDGKLVPAVDFISTMDTQRLAEWNMWYHTLNCGFRVRASGETDFPCISGQRVGMGRVYVKVRGDLNYQNWCEGIQRGSSYVSDGSCHLMDFSVQHDGTNNKLQVGEKDSQLSVAKAGSFTAKVSAAVRTAGSGPVPVELVVNGLPIAKRIIKGDGKTNDLTFNFKVSQSSWVALRVFPSGHTNPVFVVVDNKPIRANKKSAEWLLRGVDECWKQKQRTYAKAEIPAARKAYDHARTVYRKIISESK